MKNIQSTTEETWIELVPVELTEAEQTLLISTKEEDKVAKEELIAEIKTKKEKALSTEEVEIATSIYNSFKPSLEETDEYQLISVDMTLLGPVGKGLINCRVNGVHQQIRF
jgi:hypothetical protein